MAKRIIPQREAWERLGIRRSKCEHELDALIDEFATQRSTAVPHGSRRRKVGAADAANETAA